MKYELILTGKFKKGLKLAKKRGLNIGLLDSIVEKLLHGIPLEEKYIPSKTDTNEFWNKKLDYLLRTRKSY